MSSYEYSQNLIAKYRLAWDHYLSNCQNYGIECQITFGEFVNFLTTEQVETMLQHVGG